MSRSRKEASILVKDNDVMIEILSRLPLKSLLRSKCVCKWWNRLISDPIFVSNYSRRNPQYYVSGFFLQKFLYLRLYSELNFIQCKGLLHANPEPSLSFIGDDKGVHIQHSCNGLLLCSSFRCHEEDRKYYICKPTTQQYLSIPKPNCKTVLGISLAYDPNISPCYKVVCICKSESHFPGSHYEVQIYSSAAGGSWRSISGHYHTVLADDNDILFNRGVFWRGSLHWVGKGKIALRFDIDREHMVTMPMPRVQNGWTERRIGYFGESGDCLYLIEFFGHITGVFDVMEMNDYSGWFVKFQVDLNVLGIHGPYKFSVLHLGHEQVGDEDEETMVIYNPGNFVSINLREMKLKSACSLSSQVKSMDRELGLWYQWEGVFPYTNTLCYI